MGSYILAPISSAPSTDMAIHGRPEAPIRRALENNNAPGMRMVDSRKGGRNEGSGELVSIGEDGPHEI